MTLEELSPHFSTNAEIVWKAPTNQLPAKLWVYKKQPHLFSQAVISNAIVLGSLQDKGIPKSSTNRICWDYDSCPCGHTCTFSIIPDVGVLSYAFPGFRNASSEDIPGNEVIARRAWECAFLLGLDRAQLAQRGITTNFCDYDQHGKPVKNNACGRGITLARRIDGVELFGDDPAFLIEFGSHGQIRFFSVTWPELEPCEIRQVASPEQIVACIRASQTLVSPNGDETDYLGRVKSLAQAKKLTITRITPYYSDGVYGEMPKKNESTTVLTPIAQLDAVAEVDNRKVNVSLLSPILISDVNRLLKGK
jgi:hypothetical protein